MRHLPAVRLTYGYSTKIEKATEIIGDLFFKIKPFTFLLFQTCRKTFHLNIWLPFECFCYGSVQIVLNLDS